MPVRRVALSRCSAVTLRRLSCSRLWQAVSRCVALCHVGVFSSLRLVTLLLSCSVHVTQVSRRCHVGVLVLSALATRRVTRRLSWAVLVCHALVTLWSRSGHALVTLLSRAHALTHVSMHIALSRGLDGCDSRLGVGSLCSSLRLGVLCLKAGFRADRRAARERAAARHGRKKRQFGKRWEWARRQRRGAWQKRAGGTSCESIEDKFERDWKQTRVGLGVRKNQGLVARWRGSLGGRQTPGLYTAGDKGAAAVGTCSFCRSAAVRARTVPSPTSGSVVGNEGFGGLLANGNPFKELTWGNASRDSRSQDCDSWSATSSLAGNGEREL